MDPWIPQGIGIRIIDCMGCEGWLIDAVLRLRLAAAGPGRSDRQASHHSDHFLDSSLVAAAVSVCPHPAHAAIQADRIIPPLPDFNFHDTDIRGTRRLS